MKKLFDYIEIKTKITTLLPFLMMLAYLNFTGIKIKPLVSLVFFLSMLSFDFAVTSINNYVDTKTNNQILSFSRTVALVITIVLLIISIALSLFLVLMTDVIVLFIGVFSFAFGIFYSCGPVPLSRQAYGEIFSGFFYGFVLPFLVFYINSPKDIFLYFDINKSILSVQLNLQNCFIILLLCVLPACLTANIMLANNICDVKQDMAVKRFTLPFYIGTKSLILFSMLYYIAFFSVLILVLIRILSPVSLLIYAVFPQVQKNIRTFLNFQDKKKTFPIAIKNFILILSTHTLLIFLSAFLPV